MREACTQLLGRWPVLLASWGRRIIVLTPRCVEFQAVFLSDRRKSRPSGWCQRKAIDLQYCPRVWMLDHAMKT